ncbi:MAG: hypothetical protein N4J56_004261 [Chroococcidiopsis sp. SAG 2025]|uniref:translocation/assembly module TamB domain-containing protein n=1 Tax=Chroococcidiopsis sp. SAG 2025 TaxID=171389 RepID=UPI0029373420|nr:translocation/assembly module TamB domain-containing protein [Chroococcidiopsis sp. SAG 2025]MDV2994607.1 hypothetical protein [Chroococcidiopsis sp. SAG 2025]
MIQPPPQREREHRERHFRLLLLKRTGITLGVILLLGVVGGAWWAWVFLNQKLVPLVESNLSQLLGRPVEVGQLESFSLSSLRFGSSSIPATPTDPDRIRAEAVVVNFDPWQLLFNRTLELNATLVQPDIYIEQAKNGAWVDTRINPPQGGSGLIQTELETIRVQNADVVLVPNPRPGSPQGAVTLDSVGGVARFLDQNQRIRFELAGQPTRGGKLEIAGETRLPGGKTTVAIQGQNLQAADLSRLIELPTRLQAGEVENANLTVQFQPGQEQPPPITGTATIRNVTAQIENIPQKFTNTTGQLKFQGQAIALNNLSTRYGTIPVEINGSLNTLKGYNLTGQVEAVSAQNVLDTLNVESPFPVAGKLQADIQLKGAIREPVLTGNVSTIDTARIDRIPFKNIAGNFRLTTAPTTAKISFSNLRATPTAGGQITGDGQILLGDKPQLGFDFLAQNLPGNAIAQLYGTSPPFKIGNVLATAKISGTPGNIQTVAQISAPQATYPGTAEVAITNEGIVRLRDSTFKVAGGVVEATGEYAKGKFEAVVDATGIALNQFSPQLRGQLSASNLRISGTSFAPEDIQAQGQVRFSQGLAVIEQPLTAQIRWNGERIIVQKATATGLVADGTVGVRLLGANAPQITGFNLDVQARGYDLQNLNLDIPGNIALVGQADFTGQVAGTPEAPNAVGDLRLRNLSVNNIAFDPVLAGKLNFQAGQGTQLQVAGKEDRIAFTLDGNNRPTSFLIRRDRAVATGRTQGENLLVDVKNFPVTVLQNLIGRDRLKQIGAIAGEVSGNLAIDLAENIIESTVIGDVAITRPSAGRFTADAFRASIRYEGGDFSLKAGELRLGDSRIDLSGDLQAGQDRKFQFQIDFDRARIQNVLQALSIFELQDIAAGLQLPDLAGAEAVQPVSVGLPNASLLKQLRLFSEIRALIAQQQQQERASATLPPLSALNGTISGEIAVSGALAPGLQPSFDVDFELLGQDWQWGTYTVDEAIARGTFEDGVLTLLPLRLDLGDGAIAFTGQLGEELSGQLRVVSVPVATLQPFLDRLPQALPFDVTGQLNALVTLAGSLEDPQAIGEVALVEGSLNQQPIQAAQLSFDYNSARLSFASDVLISGTQPVEITGNIPVALPFASVQPDTNLLSIQANVQDEGLALLNLFTNQVTWQEGQGRLNVAVQGTLKQPKVTGNVVVKNATLKAQALPAPLTDVTGTIQLNGDRIVIPGISGQYNEGQVTAEGVLPIFADRETDNPLTVSLDDLDVALEGIYQGGVSGNVVITGTAFEPDIGGKIELMNGEIALGGREAAPSASGATPTNTPAASSATNATPDRSPIELANLGLVLGEDVRVTRQPILSFEAAGDLTINGTLDNPRPQGVVKLTGGQVNLFTTQFTLARGEEQTARFTPKGGLDPILDIQLVATVPETTGSLRIPTSPFSGEIADVPTTTNFGTLRTVRVQAAVEGPASELAENLELTSEPNRSEQEIIALLGGSFVNTLSQGDPTLGLAAIAGSTLLGNLQDNIGEIGRAIGIDEIRVFPTIVTDQTSEVSVLGLAVEAIFDITNDLSVSLSRVFAADDPFRYNLLYRLNDQILVRASTNFSGESRAEIEYEMRF